jgi:hypothetical protein
MDRPLPIKPALPGTASSTAALRNASLLVRSGAWAAMENQSRDKQTVEVERGPALTIAHLAAATLNETGGCMGSTADTTLTSDVGQRWRENVYTIDLSNVARYDTQNARSFVEFWRQFYEDDIKVLDAEERIDYFKELNIANDLTEENLRRLLRWKDPRLLTHRILSGKNKGQDNARVRKVLANLGPINQFRNDQITAAEIRGTIDQVFADGVVWKAFLQHIAQPHVYPIADQNVFRVWSLHTGTKDEQTWATSSRTPRRSGSWPGEVKHGAVQRPGKCLSMRSRPGGVGFTCALPRSSSRC